MHIIAYICLKLQYSPAPACMHAHVARCRFGPVKKREEHVANERVQDTRRHIYVVHTPRKIEKIALPSKLTHLAPVT